VECSPQEGEQHQMKTKTTIPSTREISLEKMEHEHHEPILGMSQNHQPHNGRLKKNPKNYQPFNWVHCQYPSDLQKKRHWPEKS
jgi:hypothetical protein